VNSKIRRQLRQRKSRIQRRLDKGNVQGCERPMLTARNIHYEISDKDRGIAHGGIGVFQDLARQFGLIESIDRHLVLFRFHLPYHESDHVLNLAYNALCGGTCLQDIELRRQDEVFWSYWISGRGFTGETQPTKRKPGGSAASCRGSGAGSAARQDIQSPRWPCWSPATKG
jgi:hypothetical protein